MKEKLLEIVLFLLLLIFSGNNLALNKSFLSGNIEQINKQETIEEQDFEIINKPINWGHEIPKNKRNIDTIIIHSSYTALSDNPYDVEVVLNLYRKYNVSTHYLIDRDGRIYRLVPDDYISYHAGASKMPDSRTNINQFSLGIELIHNQNESP